MKKFILISMFSLFSFAAHADKGGFFFEPMATYERGTGDVNFPAPVNNSDSKVRGFGVGTRIGFHAWETVFLGADARYSWPTFEDSALHQDVDATSWNVGPVVGIQMPFPIGLRVWGSWIFAGELDPKSSQNVDEKFKSGNGYRFGAGFKLFMVSLNAEYQHMVYDKTTLQQASVFTPNYTTNTELTNNSLILSVSFPIAL
jgi:hypothetical protein